MNHTDLITQIITTYEKHGWKLSHALLTPETRAVIKGDILVGSVPVTEGSIDALWFSRPSHNNREAWELRLLSENPYALFETFGADEPDENRQQKLKEMEARMTEHMLGMDSSSRG